MSCKLNNCCSTVWSRLEWCIAMWGTQRCDTVANVHLISMFLLTLIRIELRFQTGEYQIECGSQSVCDNHHGLEVVSQIRYHVQSRQTDVVVYHRWYNSKSTFSVHNTRMAQTVPYRSTYRLRSVSAECTEISSSSKLPYFSLATKGCRLRLHVGRILIKCW